jgi:hypothetical protein
MPDFGPTLDDYWSGLKAIVHTHRWCLAAIVGAFVLGVVMGVVL